MAKERRVLSTDVGFETCFVCSLSWIWCLFMLHNRPQDLFLSLFLCLSHFLSLSVSRALTSSLCKITHTTLSIDRDGPVLQQKSHRCSFLREYCHSHIVCFCTSSRGVCATLGKRLCLCRYWLKSVFNSFRQSLFSLLI